MSVGTLAWVLGFYPFGTVDHNPHAHLGLGGRAGYDRAEAS